MQTKTFFYNISLLFFLLLFVFSCKNKQTEDKNSLIVRYDKLIFELDTNDIKTQFNKIKESYPEFTEIYFKNVMTFPSYTENEKEFFVVLKSFITDTNNIKLYKLVTDEFNNLSELETNLTRTVKNLQKDFPEIKLPRFYTFISAFAYQGFIFDDKNGSDGLAIGLDMFLGNKFPYNAITDDSNVFADYMVRTYNKDHLTKKTIELWLDDKIFKSKGSRAIDHIIENGKKLYLMKKIMPEIQDSVLLEYSAENMKWLDENEQEMWSYFIKNNFFYTTDEYKIKRLTSPSPNSQALGMPLKSPGMTGNYLGYRIINTYMRRNKETGMSDLVKNNDAQTILESSKFKPKIR
jgi:hypothetical protein